MRYGSLITDIDFALDATFGQLSAATDNINNLDTPSYKAKSSSFNYANLQNSFINKMEPGKLEATSDPQDVSIDGQGFFQLEHPETNSKAYVRNLYITQNKDGELFSGDLRIPTDQKVPNGFSDLEVTPSGKIFGRHPQNRTKVELGQLQVVRFPSPGKLEYNGDFYSATENAGRAIESQAAPTGSTVIRQGYREGSNVDLSVEINRYKRSNSQLTTLSQLLRSINNNQRQLIQTISQILG